LLVKKKQNKTKQNKRTLPVQLRPIWSIWSGAQPSSKLKSTGKNKNPKQNKKIENKRGCDIIIDAA